MGWPYVCLGHDPPAPQFSCSSWSWAYPIAHGMYMHFPRTWSSAPPAELSSSLSTRNRTLDQWDTDSWFCNHSWPLRPVAFPQSLHRGKIPSMEAPHLYAWSQPTCSPSTSLPPCIINEQYQSPVFCQLICSHSHDSKYHTSNSSSYFNCS